jgi:hypothetical protein
LGAGGVCGPGKKKKKSDGDGDSDDGVITASGKKGKGTTEGPCGGPEGGGTVPEPGTFLLVASGLAGFFWQARRKLGHVPAV